MIAETDVLLNSGVVGREGRFYACLDFAGMLRREQNVSRKTKSHSDTTQWHKHMWLMCLTFSISGKCCVLFPFFAENSLKAIKTEFV